jgi:hypothetical protein
MINKTIKFLFTVTLFSLACYPLMVLAQSDECTPGWDCPGDQPATPPPQTCEFPTYGLNYQLIGLQWAQRGFGAPATHCCLSNGQHVPLAEAGSLREGQLCSYWYMFMGIVPDSIDGLACRCVPKY